MKRRVIRVANKTHVLSLPASWVRKYGISKGDEIDIIEKGDCLILNSEKSVANETVSLSIKSCKNLNKVLTQLYCSGYDEIELKMDNGINLSAIEDVLNTNVANFEIVNTRGKFCIIRTISAAKVGEFNNVLRRLFITVSRLEQNNDPKLIERALKLSAFCKRCLSKKEYVSYCYSIKLFALIMELEKIIFQYKKMKSNTCTGWVKRIHDLFYAFDLSDMEELNNELSKKVSYLMRKKDYPNLDLAKSCLNAAEMVSFLKLGT